jgi:hypothetical protein
MSCRGLHARSYLIFRAIINPLAIPPRISSFHQQATGLALDYLPYITYVAIQTPINTTLSCKNLSLAPAVSVLLGQKIFTGQNGNKSSCGTSGTLTAAGRKGFRS